MYSFLQRFKRTTLSTTYLPEVDGLRFLAIFMVVVIMHIPNYINRELFGKQWLNKYWESFSVEGGRGVDLFFIISGFILSLPFARMYFGQGENVSLKRYYLRRLIRLEPPYLIALLLFFAGLTIVLHQYSFWELMPHFFASATYTHGLIFHQVSTILPVAWSLEVEVQFYILAPFFFLVFRIKNPVLRWLLYSIIIITGTIYWFDDWSLAHVFKCLQFFFAGMFLADLYCYKIVLIKNQVLGIIIGLVTLIGIFFIPSLQSASAYLLKIMAMFLLFNLVLTNRYLKQIFSITGITFIGGMCYSIYLLHLGVISALGKLLQHSGMDTPNKAFIPLYFLLFSLAVIIISSVYFLVIEKPFMKLRGRRVQSP